MWLWWLAAKITGPSSGSRCSSPSTLDPREDAASGRSQVGWLTRRTARASHVRFHDGKSTGSAGAAASSGSEATSCSSAADRAGAARTRLRRWAVRTSPRARPSARRARASSARARRSSSRRRPCGPRPAATAAPRRRTRARRRPRRRRRARPSRAPRAASASACPRCAAVQSPATPRCRESSGGRASARLACRTSDCGSTPASATTTACTRSSAPLCAPTTATSRTPGSAATHALDVFRKDVQAFRRDDHLLLAALDEEASRLVHLADVAGVEPAVLERLGGGLGGAVVARRDVLAAHEDLSVGRDAHLDAGDGFPDRSLAGAERMIELTIGAVSVRP